MARKSTRKRRPHQLGMEFHTWGGKRKGAGRKPVRPGAHPHDRRPPVASRFPVHVTLKVDATLPSLRSDPMFPQIVNCLRRGKEREGFRLVHYSVQNHHLHLLVEALNAQQLSRGVQGLAIRIARCINRIQSRKGRVFVDRYFARILKTPRETRAAIAYVLNNSRRHASQRGVKLVWNWIDPCSSGAHFDGWSDRRPRPPPDEEPAVTEPGTWLLSTGWRRLGRIAINAIPGTPSRPARGAPHLMARRQLSAFDVPPENGACC